ncbi:MAG TPA: hypothetical protein DCS67_04595, partial [Clostridiales bacterium UBA8960]|nr:hypothetical protein [Clostridiales bacterium UBA8960]
KNVEYRISPHRFVIDHAMDWESAKAMFMKASYDIAIVDSSSDELEKSVLDQLKMLYPNTIRFCVSDIQSNTDYYLPKVMNSSQFQCSKSTSIDELFGLIEKVLEIDEQVKDKKLINLMSSLKHLPTVPQVYYQMSAMIENNASVDEIASRIEEDPAITSNILKLANTAFYNAKTGSIRQAIMFIGLLNVKNIILTNAVFGNDGLDPKAREIHWEHVKTTNKLLNALYVDLLGKKLNNNISSVGLLHDIGSIVLMSNFPKEFDLIYKKIKENPNLSFHDLEVEIIGFNHEKLGGHLLNLWGLPFPMIEAALWHHDPLNDKIINKELIQAVHLANHYAWKAMKFTRYDNLLKDGVFEALGISKVDFQTFFERFMKNSY